MKYELSQTFFFEAAHTLRRKVDVEPSLRIHGHTYVAEVALVGSPDPQSGMVVDLALLRRSIEEVRQALDHRFLDHVEGIGPATLENLSAYIWRALATQYAEQLSWVEVRREASGDRCRVCR